MMPFMAMMPFNVVRLRRGRVLVHSCDSSRCRLIDLGCKDTRVLKWSRVQDLSQLCVEKGAQKSGERRMLCIPTSTALATARGKGCTNLGTWRARRRSCLPTISTIDGSDWRAYLSVSLTAIDLFCKGGAGHSESHFRSYRSDTICEWQQSMWHLEVPVSDTSRQ